MKLSLSQAAKEAGKSKSRISAAIKSGELAAVRNGNKFQIDPSELFRVFPKPSAFETEIGLNVSSELSELRQNFAVLEASQSCRLISVYQVLLDSTLMLVYNYRFHNSRPQCYCIILQINKKSSILIHVVTRTLL